MSLKNAVGGVALIAGTAIGAAVLALPVTTAHLGFITTLCIYTICWFFMTLSALYLLETNLLVGVGTNLISMAEKTFGGFGKIFTFAIYLILLYALTAAYLDGASSWIRHGFSHFNFQIHPFNAAIIAALFTMCIITLGTAFTDWTNRFLMIGLISAFFTLGFSTGENINLELLFLQPNQFDITPLPLIITAFGSAIVIPTLTEYLHGKPKQLVWVVIIGSLIPLITYIIWEFVILGVIPVTGKVSLLTIQQHGHPATDVPLALQALLKNPWITQAATYFSIFALLTSLLGVTLSLFDFLADGLHLSKTFKHKLFLALITFIPPLGFTTFYPRGFIIALSFAGLFVAILLGILPAMMVYQARYRLQLKSPLKILGGKILLAFSILFFLCVSFTEIMNQFKAF